MAKANHWVVIDAEVRKRGDQTGLDTLVVHAVNDENWPSGAKQAGFPANSGSKSVRK